MSLNLRLRVSGFIGPLVLLLAVSSAGAQTVSPPVLAYVTRIVDGDTIYAMIGNRMEAIRYIGINTPDVHDPSRGDQPAGVAALEANHRLVSGQWATLTFDAEERDQPAGACGWSPAVRNRPSPRCSR